MRFGVTLPNLGLSDGPRAIVKLAIAAERSGWDGVFVWDTFGGPEYDTQFADVPRRRAAWDPWVLITAIASQTQRIRLGTMVTPLTRRRPWNVAAQAATLDQVSSGRVTLSVSLGWVPDAAFTKVGEHVDRRVRAERLDEALSIITDAWIEPWVTLHGRHFSVEALPGVPTVQVPRIPIWVVGAWPRPRSIGRALRFEGVIPAVFADDRATWVQPTPDVLEQIVADVSRPAPSNRSEIVVEGNTSRDPYEAALVVAPYEH